MHSCSWWHIVKMHWELVITPRLLLQSGNLSRKNSKHCHVYCKWCDASCNMEKVYLNFAGDHVSCLVFPSQAAGTQEGYNYGQAEGNFQNVTLSGRQHVYPNCIFHQVMFEDVVQPLRLVLGDLQRRERLVTPIRERMPPRNSLSQCYFIPCCFSGTSAFIQWHNEIKFSLCASVKDLFCRHLRLFGALQRRLPAAVSMLMSGW